MLGKFFQKRGSPAKAHQGISPWALSLSSEHSDKHIKNAKRDTPQRKDVERYVRLWLTEGIPAAFAHKPILYEIMREMIGKHLGIDSKSVSIIGSARTGYSCSPTKFPKKYDSQKSDLDFFVVDSLLFAALRAEAEDYIEELKAKVGQGKRLNADQNDHLENLPRNLRRGFIDHWKIMPSDAKRPMTKKMNLIDDHTKAALKQFRSVVDLRCINLNQAIHVRCYACWKSAILQNTHNVTELLNELRLRQ